MADFQSISTQQKLMHIDRCILEYIQCEDGNIDPDKARIKFLTLEHPNSFYTNFCSRFKIKVKNSAIVAKFVTETYTNNFFRIPKELELEIRDCVVDEMQTNENISCRDMVAIVTRRVDIPGKMPVYSKQGLYKAVEYAMRTRGISLYNTGNSYTHQTTLEAMNQVQNTRPVNDWKNIQIFDPEYVRQLKSQVKSHYSSNQNKDIKIPSLQALQENLKELQIQEGVSDMLTNIYEIVQLND